MKSSEAIILIAKVAAGRTCFESKWKPEALWNIFVHSSTNALKKTCCWNLAVQLARSARDDTFAATLPTWNVCLKKPLEEWLKSSTRSIKSTWETAMVIWNIHSREFPGTRSQFEATSVQRRWKHIISPLKIPSDGVHNLEEPYVVIFTQVKDRRLWSLASPRVEP